MSMKSVAVALSVLLFGFTSNSFADDPLEKARQTQALSAQKLAREVSFDLSRVKAFERNGYYEEARELLRRCKLLLEDDVFLPERQRRDLLAQVNQRLAVVSARVSEQKKATDNAAQQAADKFFAQQKRNGAPPSVIRGPGPSTVAGDRIGSARDQLEARQKVYGQRSKGNLNVLNDLENFEVPTREVTFAKNWASIKKLREKQLHPKEAAVLKALNSTLSIDFDNNRFREVIDYLQEKTGQTIIINEGALREAMVDYDDPVTFKARKITVRTILKKILADRGLSYVIQEGMIQVVTAARAREMTVVRTYPVSDLVGADPRFFGPFTPFVVYQNVQGLIFNIQSSIEPSYWNVNGGPGVITFHAPSMSLIVRASSEIHYMFGGGSLMGR